MCVEKKTVFPFSLQLLDEFSNFTAPYWIQSGHRLIKEHQFGIVQDGLR